MLLLPPRVEVAGGWLELHALAKALMCRRPDLTVKRGRCVSWSCEAVLGRGAEAIVCTASGACGADDSQLSGGQFRILAFSVRG